MGAGAYVIFLRDYGTTRKAEATPTIPTMDNEARVGALLIRELQSRDWL